ncbi:MAG: helix-hairpin-helix domain-containing protein [Clostridiales bacterium]|nr:helix-hairpin-helix domain-containing protein [Clostridiales bacterium]
MRLQRLRLSKSIVYAAAFALITIVSLFYKLVLSGTYDDMDIGTEADVPTVIRTDETTAITETIQTEDTRRMVSVYICGEVNNPGVYEIEAGTILNDVVMMAGGLTPQAASETIDLVYTIDANVSVYIPAQGQESVDSEYIRAPEQTLWGNIAEDSGPDAASMVNINSASREQLMTLPGIGEVTADAIIEYREQNPFARIEDIMNVSGIGEAKFNSIRDFICV